MWPRRSDPTATKPKEVSPSKKDVASSTRVSDDCGWIIRARQRKRQHPSVSKREHQSFKVPKGLTWSKPPIQSVISKPVSPSVGVGETFDDVFTEVFGVSSSKVQPTTTSTLVSTTTTTTEKCTTVHTTSKSDKWDFTSVDTIDLDVFTPSTTRSTKETSLAFEQYKEANTSHVVSDNFVRLTMRKRVRGSSGKAHKVPDYMRSRNSSFNKDNDGVGNDDGLDVIEACLDAFKQAKVPCIDSTPPRCYHGLVTVRHVVTKKKKNHGRGFYSCPLSQDEGQCEYFLWEENHLDYALQHLFTLDTTIVPVIDLDAKTLLTHLHVHFGYSSFRNGQEWAIQRIFESKQTLLVLPTGSGKSLCYQFPALFLPGITIVISPLISLMNDQYHHLPSILKQQAACMTSTTSKTQYAVLIRQVLNKKLKLLFVSPEKALSNGFQHLLNLLSGQISLVCVDEAHCISEWSHHFRPCYLRLKTVFQHAQCVLAITATASRRVEHDILKQLKRKNENDENMVLRMPWQRDNLKLSVIAVSSDEERLDKVCSLLVAEEGEFKKAKKNTGAIIMYVHQQWQTEAIATLLQERLMAAAPMQWGGTTKSKKIAFYHANMDADAKESVRTQFLNGRIKLVIATIAFGMGIDKQNVRLVIHYHVPSSIEHYVQQVGRAGRDGRLARGVLFLLPEDVRIFRSLMFSNALHRSQLQHLLELVLIANRKNSCHIHDGVMVVTTPLLEHVWLEIAPVERHVDMKAAMIETFLTLLNNHSDNQSSVMKLTVRPTGMAWCTLYILETDLRQSNDTLLQRLVACAMGETGETEKSLIGSVEVEVNGYLKNLRVHFHVSAMANLLYPTVVTVDGQAKLLMQAVRKWQAQGHVRKFKLMRPSFSCTIEWSTQCPQERTQYVQQCVERLYGKHIALETMELHRLTKLYGALHAASVAYKTNEATDDSDSSNEANIILERKLEEYFDQQEAETYETRTSPSCSTEDNLAMKKLMAPLTADLVERIERDVEQLIAYPLGTSRSQSEEMKTNNESVVGMQWHCYNIARVFHGLPSPCFIAKEWHDDLFWRKYSDVAFEQLVIIADKILQNSRARSIIKST